MSTPYYLKPKLLGVVFGTWLATVIFALVLYVLLVGGLHADFDSLLVGLGFFLITAAFMFYAAFVLANRLLFPKGETADYVVFGGIRSGTYSQAIVSVKQATWPFAKLMATRDELWIHVPWGELRWRRSELRGPIRKCLMPGQWKIVEFDPEEKGPITFFLVPWRSSEFRKNLEALGFEVK